MLLAFVIMISAMSCNSEELFVEPVVEEVINYEDEEDVVEEEDEPEDNLEIDASLPCDFDLNSIEPNSTILINCIMDLQGQTINVPANVSIIYEGGDIINGSFNFSDNTIISGELLNSSLTLSGSTPQLKDPIFNFIPQRWDIVEGIVNDEVARNNRDIFKKIIVQIKSLGAEIFSIDKMDAFFNVDENYLITVPQDAAISIPSDLTLKMSNETHIRMQPNANKQPALLSVTNGAKNVIIDGGVLHGDRDEHDYSDGGTHEWGHLLRLKACSFVTVKNVTFMDATGDGIDVSALGHSFDSNYTFSHDLLITDNIFIRSRRNNLSITDGRDIIIENNEFIDAGIHTDKSRGTAPGFAIDVEAVRGTNPAGPYQIAEHITIRNNIERGSRVGGFTVHTGDYVTIDGNEMENGISYSTSIGTVIKNNTIVSKTDKTRDNGIAITAGRNDLYDANYGNRVYNNTIEGYSNGIVMTNTDLEVYSNTIINCKTSMVFLTIRNSKAYGNIIKSTRENSDGIISHPTVEYIDNVIIGSALEETNTESKQNIVEVTRTPFKFVNVNNETGQENYKLIIKNNKLASSQTSTFSSVSGFQFLGNIITQGGIRLVNVKNGNFINNTIASSSSHGIRLDSGCSNINITDHDISVVGNYKCIAQTTSDGINISINNNNCN